MGLAIWGGQPPLMGAAHRHNDVELNVVERGAIAYLFGGQRLELRAGDTCLFWAAMPHQLIAEDGATQMRWITLPLALFLGWRLPDVLTATVLRGTTLIYQPRDYGLPATFELWNHDLAGSDSERVAIVQLELEAYVRRLALRVQQPPHASAPPRRANSVEQMAQLIAERSSESLSVATIAAVAGLHPHYAMQLFRETFGVSILTYLNQHRVARAQQLLITTELNVAEVGYEAGFASASRFYSTFKAICGVAPGAYRAALRGGRRAR